MIPISRIPNDEKIFGLFPHFCYGSRDILFFRFFFQMRSFSNRFSNLYFHMPRMTQKLFQFYFQVCFLPFFVVGGDVLCVKEFKCLYTRHLAKAWQGMFLKKKIRTKIDHFYCEKMKNFLSNGIKTFSIVFNCVLLHIAKIYLNLFAYCFLLKYKRNEHSECSESLLK